MITPFLKLQFIVPLLVIIVLGFILGVWLIASDNDNLSILFFVITMLSLILLLTCILYNKQNGHQYYVVLEDGGQIDLTQYEIEEQKGELFIIKDK